MAFDEWRGAWSQLGNSNQEQGAAGRWKSRCVTWGCTHQSVHLSARALSLSLLPPLVPENLLFVIMRPLLIFLSSGGKGWLFLPGAFTARCPQLRSCHLPKWQEWYFPAAQVLLHALNISGGEATGEGTEALQVLYPKPSSFQQQSTRGLSFSHRWLFLLDSVLQLYIYIFYFWGPEQSQAHIVQALEKGPLCTPAEVPVGNNATHPPY